MVCDVSSPAPSRRLLGESTLMDPLVRELLAARVVGVLATFDPAGSIHAVPMWFAAHEHCVLLATSARSRKVECLDNDPRATLVLHDSRPGFEVCGASLSGTVEVVRGPGALPLVDLVHLRYVTEEGAADRAVREFLESDDVALRLLPASCVTWDERDSPAAEALRASRGALPLRTTDPRP